MRSIIKYLAKRLLGIIRRDSNDRLYWSVYYTFNFGDWIGPFLYMNITKKEPLFAMPSSYSRDTVIMSAGSILSLARENCVIWGSGILDRKASFPKPRKILSVRGPYTRECCLKLGYDCPEIYGDPGILLPNFYKPKSRIKKFELGIVPHFRDLVFVADKFKDCSKSTVIDPRHPIDQVVDHIISCNHIVSSSLHGLIISHAYGVPAGWVSFGNRLGGDGIKFFDHFASLKCYKPNCLENALELSVKDLSLHADSSPRFEVEAISKILMDICPYSLYNAQSD